MHHRYVEQFFKFIVAITRLSIDNIKIIATAVRLYTHFELYKIS